MLRASAQRLRQATGWRYARCGMPTSVLKRETFEVPAAPAGGVVVKLSHAPIHAGDIGMVMGKLGGFQAPSYPAVGGMDGVGVVEEVGAGVSGVAKGDKVVLARGNVGSWSTYVATDAGNVDSVKDVALADGDLACLSALCSAWRMASDFGSVQGAACSVLGSDLLTGAALVAVLKAKGAKQVVAVRSSDPASKAAVDADFIFNGVGGSMLRAATDCAEGATVVTFANSSNERMDVAGTQAVISGTSLVSFWYPRWQQSASVEERQQTYREVADFVKGSKFSLSTKQFKFADFEKAFDAAVEGGAPVLAFA
eukprot:TRINITY_DN65355_c0_g1_i1.p2 TRINITY_DN65355_c0_g1~~TRINITY_DN65355_c0_g1_i1.p2  ORF type:complete len:344 (+),score=105.81 TRINITY_DN65355_c0_g1_i1:102-1034(+)